METKFTWNKTQSQIIRGVGIDAQLGLFAANTAERMMSKYVPFKQGLLSQNTSTYTDGKDGFIRYNVPYANYQYNGVGFEHTTEFHPLATYEWDKAFFEAEKDKYIATVNAYRILRSL